MNDTMPRRGVAALPLLLACGLLAACGGPAGDGRETGASAGAAAAAGEGVGVTTRAAPVRIPIGAPSGDACAADGRWRACSAERRLEQAGLVLRRLEKDSGRVREPGLSVPGTAYQVGRATLTLFYYADGAARERDQARLDSTRFVRWDQEQTIAAERTLVANANLLAIFDSRSETQRERVANALTAGPPQKH